MRPTDGQKITCLATVAYILVKWLAIIVLGGLESIETHMRPADALWGTRSSRMSTKGTGTHYGANMEAGIGK